MGVVFLFLATVSCLFSSRGNKIARLTIHALLFLNRAALVVMC